MELGIEKLLDNDSHNQMSEEISTNLNLVSQDPEGEGGMNPSAEPGSNSVSVPKQDSCISKPQEMSNIDQRSEVNNYPEEQSKIERDSSWNNKDQSMESILADWNEDIEAFEMMEKDDL